MNTNQLDYFLKAYDERSYTAAARLVPMSAQGLTKAIHSLEGELGVPLFRAGAEGRIAPTAYAEEFRAFCLESQDARARLAQAFARIDGAAGESIRLAAAIGSLGLLGIDLISGFRKEYGNVDVTCDDLPDLRVEEALREGADDLGITVLPTGDEFETRPLASCERYVWVSAADPLARKREVGVRDLQGRQVALVGASFKNYGLLLAALEDAGVTPAEITTSSEMIWLHQFAKAGTGVAFTAQSVLPLFKDDPDVVALPFPSMPYEVGVSWLRAHALTPAEEAFVQACERRSCELEAQATGRRGRLGVEGLAAGLLKRLAGKG